MDSTSISTALQNMDVGGGNMEDAMQNFIKNHVLSNPITCESTKTKWVIKHLHTPNWFIVSIWAAVDNRPYDAGKY